MRYVTHKDSPAADVQQDQQLDEINARKGRCEESTHPEELLEKIVIKMFKTKSKHYSLNKRFLLALYSMLYTHFRDNFIPFFQRSRNK